MAQELLTTFTDDLNGVMMQPSETGGAYNIYVDDKILFSRKEQDRFPDIKELKQMIRDIVDPERPLGLLMISDLCPIVREVGTTERTIKAHRHNLMAKLHAKSLAELVLIAERLGILASANVEVPP